MKQLIYSFLIVLVCVCFVVSDSFAKRGGRSRSRSSSSHSSYSKKYKKHKSHIDIPSAAGIVSGVANSAAAYSIIKQNGKAADYRKPERQYDRAEQTQKIIHCKNKKKIITDNAWEQGDNVVYIFGNGQRTIPKAEVERITAIRN